MAAAVTPVRLDVEIEEDQFSDGTPVYVASCCEIDIASQGSSVEEATKNLVEAVNLWFSTASREEVEASILAARRKNQRIYTTRIEVPYAQVAGAVGR